MKNIMVKSAIAVAIAAATTATTIADTKVYGRFRAVLACTDAGNNTDTDCGLENRSSRFGIKVNQEISDGLTAFGKYEFGVNLDEGALSNGEQTNRLAYVGLKGGFGEVSIGTRWSPLYLFVASPVDPTQAFGGTWIAGSGIQTDFRNSDTINYKNKFGAAKIHLQVQVDDDDAGSDFADEVQFGAGFKAGPVNLGVAYADQKDVASILGFHADTKFGPVGLGASIFSKDSDTVGGDADSFILQGQFGFGGGRGLTVQYGQTDNDANGAADPSMIAAEYEHKLSKNFRWFAGLEIDDLDVAGTDDVLSYGAGMRLEF